MLGLILTEKEMKEIEYLLKREMDEILFDFEDERIDYVVKRSMEERYAILFQLFSRITAPVDRVQYIRKRMHK
ncbi:hypothetical protein P6P90_12815 [Ectobacillus antri]|jgi:hypothetical protein|uniref:Uncharacterized protein n=1 Tax=Ectobacillus antri TaxID=2486280 RepID=A0ABT6H870_9BACI|nr:hypothetical protein [Ectobacillus antri]MDG4657905.1 hypothetical protein [Ectobacillus antri]MDG5754842.1 hypothetical protein [Ectobacillus antri]